MSNTLNRKVYRAFDAAKLTEICVKNSMDFNEYGVFKDLGTYKNERQFWYFKNNGSNILATAHLDSVQEARFCDVSQTHLGPLAISPQLDDRLGAYVILEMLPKLGITVDWLLTTGEETGDSTAKRFSIDKQYNWMFSFDRRGTDVVMYDYATQALRDKLEEVDANVGHGSFSDICYLKDLGCAGFNWGVGYQDYHSMRSHAWLNDTFSQIEKFVLFYRKNHQERFEYDKTIKRYSNGYVWSKEEGWSDGRWEGYTGYFKSKYSGKSYEQSHIAAVKTVPAKEQIEAEEEKQNTQIILASARRLAPITPITAIKNYDPSWPEDCPTCGIPMDLGYCHRCCEDWWEAWDAEFETATHIRRVTQPELFDGFPISIPPEGITAEVLG